MKKLSRFFFVILFSNLLVAFIVSCDKSEDQNSVTLKDADGNVYKTVKIGTQVWMSENLRTTKYNDGTLITNVSSETQWGITISGAYCNYDNVESNAASYGRLYNWYAVNTGKLAPTGWHVPTDEDWMILENYLIANGYNYDGSRVENKIAKSLASISGWVINSNAGTPGAYPEGNNSSGYTALPSGERNDYGAFYDAGKHCSWWSTTEFGTSSAYGRRLFYSDNYLRRSDYNKKCGFSVRLVQD